jgi:hypothetical protein
MHFIIGLRCTAILTNEVVPTQNPIMILYVLIAAAQTNSHVLIGTLRLPIAIIMRLRIDPLVIFVSAILTGVENLAVYTAGGLFDDFAVVPVMVSVFYLATQIATPFMT